ncbi:tRNA lysidine(34) synthetase [Herbiconiux daphne]|uniref:tRNA(Ile)-lysidine synthase n=1 Tax=Herbiconiux daphne TaxID=2970914 RepID=A0ABT2GWJ8_9MICO|nr:tRNA lysidine(34) synthetase TilS [Herbiconiux daphne]MCS5732339.1 tRNA lysidine(34) synthetase TilS [Herbiconiux daphne]
MHPPERRPRLTPAIADVRRAVRDTLAEAALAPDDLVLVALSGGPDSLALAAATAFEAPRAGLRAGAIIVDHSLQEGSDAVASRAADQARSLGLAPVLVTRVQVGAVARASAFGAERTRGGPEALARDIRYAAIDRAVVETGARAVLLGHTLDDQAETVLLGLARGAGAASLTGMARFTPPPGAAADAHHDHGRAPAPAPAAPAAAAGSAGVTPAPTRPAHVAPGTRIRPLLGIRRATTEAFCADSSLTPWHDPHNDSPDYARVRVRRSVLPVLEAELGPGIAEALARTADQLREDDDTLHDVAIETIEDLVEHAEAGIAVSVGALEANPPALRNRIIRYVVESEFGVSLSRAQTLAAVALVTDWHGQKGVDLPGIRVVRQAGRLEFSRVHPGATAGDAAAGDTAAGDE